MTIKWRGKRKKNNVVTFTRGKLSSEKGCILKMKKKIT